jgi:hypothetical protein
MSELPPPTHRTFVNEDGRVRVTITPPPGSTVAYADEIIIEGVECERLMIRSVRAEWATILLAARALSIQVQAEYLSANLNTPGPPS